MQGFLLILAWHLWPYILIVCIGYYINGASLEYNMHSEEPSTSSSKEEETQPEITKKKRTRKKKGKESTTLTAEPQIPDTASLETFIESEHIETKKFNTNCEDNIKKQFNHSDYTVYTNVALHGENVADYKKPYMSKFFVINEELFQDLEPTMLNDDTYYNYRLYKVMKTDNNMGEADDELTKEDLTEALLGSVEKITIGIIINSNVFLTHRQYNTIRHLEKGIYTCTVCEFQCDGGSVGEHLSCITHARKLNEHRPLKKFDLSITRKINDNLHCGVCNAVYPITKYREHESSKTHEGNLLFAINKVSDIFMYDSKKTTQMLNTNNIQEPNNAPSIWSGSIDHNNIRQNARSLESRSSDRNSESRSSDRSSDSGRANSRNRSAGTTNFRNTDRTTDFGYSDRTTDFGYSDRTTGYINSDRTTEFGFSNRTTDFGYSDRTSDFGHSNRTTDFGNADSNTDFRNSDAKNTRFDTKSENYLFGKNTYNNIKIYEEELEEYTLPIEGVSYASMASKPRVNVPKFLKIDLGSKEVRVKFESWNMVTQIDSNQLYCMVCNKSFLIRFKAQHCSEDAHKKLLAKCAVVGAFEDYLIRDVNEKLFHCGHCNNLQYKNDMRVHVQKYHPIKNQKNMSERPESRNTDRDIPTETNMSDTNNDSLKAIERVSVGVSTEDIKKYRQKLDIFGNFKFAPFGNEIVVSNLGCHMIMKSDSQYMCGLCNVIIKGELIDHVYETTHMQFINMTPFIRPFQSNLIRAIRGHLHCALCNILIPVSSIYNHNISPEHTNALASALGMVKSERPRQEVKYQYEKPVDFNKEFERFLATLPPSSRAALTTLKIKNHEGEILQLSDSSNSSSTSCGTPIPMSINNSPIHTINTTSVIDGVTPSYPNQGLLGINPVTETENTPNFPKEKTNFTPCYPNEGHNLNFPQLKDTFISDYPKRSNCTFDKSKLTPLSVIESGLPRVRTGSPIPPFLPALPHMTASMGLSPARARLSSPIRRPEDMELANDLISLHNQPAMPNNDIKIENVDMNVEKVEMQKGVPMDDDVEKVEKKKKHKSKGQDMKKDIKNMLRSESDTEEVTPFKLEETVLLKLKSSYFKVTNTAYQSLVHLSNGTRFCFVCSTSLDYNLLQKHVDSTEHIKNMTKNKFLYNFGGPLFRQMYLMYHCAICNVTMSRKEVKMHLDWSIHIHKFDQACRKLNKKIVKDALKSGAREYSVETQKEFLYVNIPEPVISIVTYVQSSKVEFEEMAHEKKLVKKSQMIILRGNMMKICFEAWHGVAITKNGAKCIICQQELSDDTLTRHLESKYHNVALGITFEKQYYPALIRKINENTVNCVICNLELPNNDSLVFEHIIGRKHEKNYNTIIEKTSHADSYSDCYKYPLTL